VRCWSCRLDGRIIGVVWGTILALFVAMYVLREQAGLARLARVLGAADPWWVLGALTTQLLIFGFVVATYRILLQRLGHRIGWWPLARLQVQREVVGAVTPLGGAASLYVYLRGLKHRAVATDDALLAAGMRGAADSVAFLATLALVLAIHPPPGSVLLGLALTMVVVLCVITVVLRLGTLRRQCERRLPGRVQQFLVQSRAHALRPIDLLGPFALAVLARIAGAAMLYAALRALGEHPTVLSPMVATVIGNLSRRVAPVFQGLGVVEASVAATLEHQGISDAAAIGAALLCRVNNLWLPLSLALLAQVGEYLRVARPLPWTRSRIRPAARPRVHDGLSAS
jgi:uncharacterized membrane protein YbhN (UPF0104 family)